jgi:hypothetical protein
VIQRTFQASTNSRIFTNFHEVIANRSKPAETDALHSPQSRRERQVTLRLCEALRKLGDLCGSAVNATRLPPPDFDLGKTP